MGYIWPREHCEKLTMTTNSKLRPSQLKTYHGFWYSIYMYMYSLSFWDSVRTDKESKLHNTLYMYLWYTELDKSHHMNRECDLQTKPKSIYNVAWKKPTDWTNSAQTVRYIPLSYRVYKDYSAMEWLLKSKERNEVTCTTVLYNYVHWPKKRNIVDDFKMFL